MFFENILIPHAGFSKASFHDLLINIYPICMHFKNWFDGSLFSVRAFSSWWVYSFCDFQTNQKWNCLPGGESGGGNREPHTESFWKCGSKLLGKKDYVGSLDKKGGFWRSYNGVEQYTNPVNCEYLCCSTFGKQDPPSTSWKSVRSCAPTFCNSWFNKLSLKMEPRPP